MQNGPFMGEALSGKFIFFFLPHCIIVLGNFNSVMIGQLGRGSGPSFCQQNFRCL